MQKVRAGQRSFLSTGVVSRRNFLSGVSFTFALSACRGSGDPDVNAPVLLSTASEARSLRAVATTAAVAVPSEIAPSANWNGFAGSGFGYLPSDPLRQTAKPAMRLIVPPNQAYTDSLLVGVSAFANDGGTLIKNLGINSIIVYFEGNKIEITNPSYETITAENGAQVSYLGWWFRLKHDGRNGEANLFIEAVPGDRSMQNRVLGPYLFLPSSSLYDLELSVAPSLPEVSGSRYSSIRAALGVVDKA